MRHRVAGRRFSLPSDQRQALLKGLVRSLFEHGKIMTTETRAKEIKPIAEKLITTARRNDAHAIRLVRSYIDSNVPRFGVNAENGKLAPNPNYVVPKLLNEIAPRFRNRPGGYTRITKIGARRGDGAPMVMLELVEGEEVVRAAAPAAPVVAQRRRGIFGRKR